MMNFQNKKNGFTLIEILIVLALILIFLFLTIPFTLNFYQERLLEEETAKLANNLKIAQSRAMAGKYNNSWGIRFFEGYYVLFMGDYYEEPGRNEQLDQTFNMRGEMRVEGVVEVVFEKNMGKPNIIGDNN